MRWPPLIDAGQLPRWVVARDTLATLFAWGVLLYILRDLGWMVAYFVLQATGIDIPSPWAPGEMVRDTLPFLKVVALLVLWLVTFALARWQVLTNRDRATNQPEALGPTQQAGTFGVSVEVLHRLQVASSCTVRGVDPHSGRGGPDTEVTDDVVAPPSTDTGPARDPPAP